MVSMNKSYVVKQSLIMGVLVQISNVGTCALLDYCGM